MLLMLLGLLYARLRCLRLHLHHSSLLLHSWHLLRVAVRLAERNVLLVILVLLALRVRRNRHGLVLRHVVRKVLVWRANALVLLLGKGGKRMLRLKLGLRLGDLLRLLGVLGGHNAWCCGGAAGLLRRWRLLLLLVVMLLLLRLLLKVLVVELLEVVGNEAEDVVLDVVAIGLGRKEEGLHEGGGGGRAIGAGKAED